MLLAWIFIGSGGSSLLAGLGHAALTGFTPLTWGIDPTWVLQARAVVLVAAAIVIVAISRPSFWLAAMPGASRELR